MFVGCGNSTAYPEVPNTPIVATGDLLRVTRAEHSAIVASIGSIDDEWEPGSKDRTTEEVHLVDGTDDTLDGESAVLFWHTNHQLVVKEWLHQLKRFPIVIDGSPGDGTFGVVCMMDRIKYLPLPLCVEHQTVLQRLWQNWITDNVLLKDSNLISHCSLWVTCHTGMFVYPET